MSTQRPLDGTVFLSAALVEGGAKNSPHPLHLPYFLSESSYLVWKVEPDVFAQGTFDKSRKEPQKFVIQFVVCDTNDATARQCCDFQGQMFFVHPSFVKC